MAKAKEDRLVADVRVRNVNEIALRDMFAETQNCLRSTGKRLVIFGRREPELKAVLERAREYTELLAKDVYLEFERCLEELRRTG